MPPPGEDIRREANGGTDIKMKTIAILVNIGAPGIGTLLVKKWWQAIIQILMIIVAVILNFTGIGAILGIPIAIVAWIWAIVSAASYQPQPAI